MEERLFESGSVKNQLGKEYEKEIRKAIAPILNKSNHDKVKRSDILRVLISVALSYRLPSEFNRAILSLKKKSQTE